MEPLSKEKTRCEASLEASEPEPRTLREGGIDPEQEALQADSVGLALLVILDTLTPAERLAFVLHDIFTLPFDEIAPIVERSPAATRQLASRARRRVRCAGRVAEADLVSQREVVDAFQAASRNGDFDALLAVLDPDIVFRADRTFMQFGVPKEVRGAPRVARQFLRRTQAARPALVNGSAGLIVAPRGRLLFVFDLTIRHGKIVEIKAVADPTRLRQLHLSVLDD